MRLLNSCPEDLQDACAVILRKVRRSRVAAQKPVQSIHATLAEEGFKRRIVKFVAKIKYRGEGNSEPTIGRFAHRGMNGVLTAFFEAADKDLSDTGSLHQFRIAGKELRYTMEIFAVAFEASFRDELYPLVEELQEKLGQVNDHASALVLLHDWTDAARDSRQTELIHRLLDAESDSLAKAQAQFLAWWTHDWAVELRRRFQQVLESKPAEKS